MSLLDKVKFDSPSDEILVYKFPSEELRIGSQLIVNQSQEAILFKSGQALDIFGPGTHTLSTNNIPLLNKLINLPFGGKTPFAAEVWFVSKTVKRDIKWGTRRTIQILDPKFNYPISVRASGRWGIRIKDTRNFMAQIVGTLDRVDSERVYEYFIAEITQKFSDGLANFLMQNKISIFETNAHLNNIATLTAANVKNEFDHFGIEIINFNIERISIPEEEQKKFQEVMGKKMEIEQLGQTEMNQTYLTQKSLDIMDKAAENDGVAGGLLAGGIGAGMGLSGGFQAGQKLGENLNVAQNRDQSSSGNDQMTRLKKLKEMFDADLISHVEFDKKKKEILDSI